MEQNSSVTFGEAQVALARQWVAGDLLTNQKEIILSMPREEEGLSLVATTDSEKEKGKKDKEKPTTFKVPIPEDDEAARRVVERFQNGARGVRSDNAVADTVAQHMLGDETSLLEEDWLGTEEEELNACVFLFIGWMVGLLIVRGFSSCCCYQLRFRVALHSLESYDRG